MVSNPVDGVFKALVNPAGKEVQLYDKAPVPPVLDEASTVVEVL